MGADKIYDVSFGADICTYMHLKAVSEKRVGKIISQPCAALTDYILKYKHELIPYLSPVHSPILCGATYIRKYAGDNNAIAVLSPCIAKKTEFEDTGIVEYNVTFGELERYFAENNIRPDSGKFEFDGLPSYSGAVYPMPGGLKECLKLMDPTLRVINSEGVPHVYHDLDKYLATPEKSRPDVFDVLSCDYGCTVGPGVPAKHNKFEIAEIMENVKNDSFSRQSKQTVLSKNKQYKHFDSVLKLDDFLRSYTPKIPMSSQFRRMMSEGRTPSFTSRAVRSSALTVRLADIPLAVRWLRRWQRGLILPKTVISTLSRKTLRKI